MSMLNEATRPFVSENKTNAANMPKSAGAAPHGPRYLGIQERVCPMSASATNHQPRNGLMLRVAAGTGEFHPQLQERNKSESGLSNLSFHRKAAKVVHTTVQVAGQPLACRACEAGGWAVNHGAGLAGLGLSAPAVPELGAQDEEAAR